MCVGLFLYVSTCIYQSLLRSSLGQSGGDNTNMSIRKAIAISFLLIFCEFYKPSYSDLMKQTDIKQLIYLTFLMELLKSTNYLIAVRDGKYFDVIS